MADQAFAWYAFPFSYPNPKLRLACYAAERYLGEHVRGGYRFLMQNYRAGDKICIFGAWTLRHSPPQKQERLTN